jgi:hypothetical protein
MNDLSEVKEDIRNIVETLLAVRRQMAGVEASVPPGAAEMSQEDCDAEPDLPTEIRAVMGTCITDSLDPMIRDLRDLLRNEAANSTPSGEACQE